MPTATPKGDERRAREYELVYILKPNVSTADARKVSDRIVDVVGRVGAKLTHVDNWGKRKLAYPIKRHKRGVFVFVKLIGFNDMVAELERNLRILDDVVRYQTIRLDEVDDVAEVSVDPEEVEFRDIETDADDDDDEPTFEERLGMRNRSRERAAAQARETEAAEAAANTSAEDESAPAEASAEPTSETAAERGGEPASEPARENESEGEEE